MKIVFLDFDGVLNSHERCDTDLNPRLVEMLNHLHDVEFVITSTWRLNNTVEQLEQILRDHGFTGRVLDKTPSVISGQWRFRGIDIKTWINDNTDIIGCPSHEFDDYVILDDDSDMLLEQKNNFINVDHTVGITPKTIWLVQKKLRLKGSERIMY